MPLELQDQRVPLVFAVVQDLQDQWEPPVQVQRVLQVYQVLRVQLAL